MLANASPYKHEQALQQEQLWRFEDSRLRCADVPAEVVARGADQLTGPQGRQLAAKQVPVQGGRRVEIGQGAPFRREVGQVAVVRVRSQDSAPVDEPSEFARNSGLARPRRPGYADDLHPGRGLRGPARATSGPCPPAISPCPTSPTRPLRPDRPTASTVRRALRPSLASRWLGR